MFVARWRPLQEPFWGQFQQLQNEVNQIFRRWGDENPREFPAVNVREGGDHLFVEAELPGMALDDLEIYVTGANQLTIKGERKPCHPENGVQHRQERLYGSFVRTLSLPVPVDAATVEARLENGVLKISLPKHENAKPRKIVVKSV